MAQTGARQSEKGGTPPVKRSLDRVLTTHVGSLPRPADLLQMNDARANGGPVDPRAWAARVKSAISVIVQLARVRGRYRQRRRVVEVELVELRQRAAERFRRERFPRPRLSGEGAGQKSLSGILRRVRSHPAVPDRQRLDAIVL